MMKRCSHCSNNGHNSRTCPTRPGGGGVRLFGVRLTDGVGTMKKSASVGCLSSLALSGPSSAASSSGDRLGHLRRAGGVRVSGYVSDDPVHASSSSSRSIQRKKGIPWTEEEHRKFLLGLQKLGKGDWRGISKNFVVTRTPTQVASHAQKYFIRQSNASRRRRRTSLFDMVPEMPNAQVPFLEERSMRQTLPLMPENTNVLPSLHLGPRQGPEVVTNHATEASQSVMFTNTPMTVVPTYYHAFIPVPLSFWPPTPSVVVPSEHVHGNNQLLKPTTTIPKEPANVDEVLGMSNLNIGEGSGTPIEPSRLSLKLISSSNSRQSAFHISPSNGVPDLNQGSNSPIHAV